MIPSRTLNHTEYHGLIEHLAEESRMLRRIQLLSAQLTASGPGSSGLAVRQPDLLQLLSDVSELQARRRRLRAEIAASWNCDPEEVRLSRIKMPTRETQRTLHDRRRELTALTAQTVAGIRVTQCALGGWLTIVSSLLGEIFSPTGDRDRYGADGQRVAPRPQLGIQLRT
jgi:hypothetical protein